MPAGTMNQGRSMSVNVSALRRGRRHRAHVTRCGGQISWRCRPCMPRGGGLAWSPLPPRRIYPENIQPRSRETGACARACVCVCLGERGGGTSKSGSPAENFHLCDLRGGGFNRTDLQAAREGGRRNRDVHKAYINIPPTHPGTTEVLPQFSGVSHR